MERKRCPVSTGGPEENNKPLTFLESLTLTSQLQSEQVVGITTDLFIAGIDSVSYFMFMSFPLNPVCPFCMHACIHACMHVCMYVCISFSKL